jgi:hypothetical protein
VKKRKQRFVRRRRAINAKLRKSDVEEKQKRKLESANASKKRLDARRSEKTDDVNGKRHTSENERNAVDEDGKRRSIRQTSIVHVIEIEIEGVIEVASSHHPLDLNRQVSRRKILRALHYRSYSKRVRWLLNPDKDRSWRRTTNLNLHYAKYNRLNLLFLATLLQRGLQN